MVEAVQSTLFYMNTEAPIPVHSTYAALPYEVRTFFFVSIYLVIVLISFCSSTGFFPWRFHMYVRSLGEYLVAHLMYRSLIFVICLQRVLYEEMPTKFFFDLLRETDQDFVDRTGWFYRHDQPLYIPSPCVLVQPPHLPEGSRPFSPAAPSVFPSPFPSPDGNWVSRRLTLVQWQHAQQHLLLLDSCIGLMIP